MCVIHLFDGTLYFRAVRARTIKRVLDHLSPREGDGNGEHQCGERDESGRIHWWILRGACRLGATSAEVLRSTDDNDPVCSDHRRSSVSRKSRSICP